MLTFVILAQVVFARYLGGEGKEERKELGRLCQNENKQDTASHCQEDQGHFKDLGPIGHYFWIHLLDSRFGFCLNCRSEISVEGHVYD